MATTKITRIENAKQAKQVLGTMVKSDAEARHAFVVYGTWIGFLTLKDGNKQPLELAESSGLAKYWINALKRCVLKQDVKYRTEQDEAYAIAQNHAETVAGMVLDKKQDDSEAAKKRRAEAKKKRDAEKKRIADLEAENVRLKAAGAKDTKGKGNAQTKGGTLVAPDGRVALTLAEDEYKAAIAYIKAQRAEKGKPKAVDTKQAATA